jgi:hypothetical protein
MEDDDKVSVLVAHSGSRDLSVSFSCVNSTRIAYFSHDLQITMCPRGKFRVEIESRHHRGRVEAYTGYWWGNLRERDHL